MRTSAAWRTCSECPPPTAPLSKSSSVSPQPEEVVPFSLPFSLPSAVQSVRVTLVQTSEAGTNAEAVGGEAHVQVTVEKSVPPIGCLLLATALMLSNSGGPTADLQVKGDRSPPEPWLRASTWRGMCSTAGTLVFVLLQPGGLRSIAVAVPRVQAIGVACGAIGVAACFFDAPTG